MIKDVIKENFRIKNITRNKWYIVYYPSIKNLGIYLHKDMTLHDICGSLNFFETKKEAKDFLNLYFLKNNFLKLEDFIKEEEFMV